MTTGRAKKRRMARMSGAQFAAIRMRLGMTLDEMAKALGGYNLQQVWRWEGGHSSIPPAVRILVRLLPGRHGQKREKKPEGEILNAAENV